MMNNEELRKALVVASHRAYYRGIQTNNGGNVSARIPGTEHMLIKASKTSFIDGTEKDFVIADLAGDLVEGTRPPSREATLHGFIYRALPEVNAVVHTHSVHAIAWASLGGDVLARLTHHARLKIDGEVPIFRVKTASVQAEDLPMIGAAFAQGKGRNAFILEAHGIVAMGKDPIAAEHMAELIEETVQIAILERMLGTFQDAGKK